MAFTQDFRTQRRNYADGDSRIGEQGRLWYDSETNTIRVGDGVTPGGIVVSAEGNSNVDLSAVDQHIIPAVDVTYDLGTETKRWRDLYLSGDTIKLGNASISAKGDGIALPAGSTVAGVLIGSIRILGTVSSLLDLEAIIDPVVGDSYVVSFFSPLRLFTYDGIRFNDLGEFQGPRGEQGYTGSRGDFGYTGSIGLTGSQGDTGFTGSQGEFGYTGSLGYAGSQGNIGYTGSRGEFGYTGSQGDLGYTGSKGDFGEAGFTGSQGIAGFTGSQGEKGADGTGVTIAGSSNTQSDLSINYSGNTGDGYVVKSTGNLWIWSGSEWNDVGRFVGYTGSQGDIGFTGSAGQDGVIGRDGYTGSQGDIGFTGSAGQDGVIGRDGYTGSQGDIGYTGSAVEGLVSDGVSSITIQSGYTLIFPDGSNQLSAAPRMYTNADAENGLSLSDLKPGDYYYDDINAAIYICYDTGLGYFDILDLTVRS